MKTKGIMITALALALWGSAMARAAEPVEPNYAGITAWAMGGSEFREIRAGYRAGWLEGLLGLNHRGAMETKKAAEDKLGLRAYLLVHAVDANMVGTWFGSQTPLPDGTLYLGPYVGWEFADEDFEWGIVVGGQIEINPRAAFIAEFQRAWDALPAADKEVFLAGLRIYFGK